MSKQLIMYGASWCPDCHRSRKFLDAKGIKYRWTDIDEDQAAGTKVAELNNGNKTIPTIIFPDNSTLSEPTDRQLEDHLKQLKLLSSNKSSAQANQKVHEVVMIGAGPAALSAAIYTTREDIETLLIERGVIGGLAAVTDVIDNYPGFPEGVHGLELADGLKAQAERFGAAIELGEVNSINDQGEIKKLATTEGDIYAKAILIATGSDYKKTGVPGETEFYARGVHYCATCDGAFYRDKRLVVIGGGNSAIQESIFLTRFASHIDLLVRSSIKASEVLQKELDAYVKKGKISIHLGMTPKEIAGDENGVNRVVATDQKGQDKTFATDGVFVFIGLTPNTGFLAGSAIRLDKYGFIQTDDNLQTDIRGVFAAGDVRSGATMQIASAAGEGATAALKIREYLEGKLGKDKQGEPEALIRA